MSYLLPAVIPVFLGITFDLSRYEFTSSKVYYTDNNKPDTQLTTINTLTAKYQLIGSQVQLRKFLGLDVATGLKSLVGVYTYGFDGIIRTIVTTSHDDKLIMGVKINLRTVNESMPFDAPTARAWKLKDPRRVGSHYVKSLIYGSDVFMIFYIMTRNAEHKRLVRRSLVKAVGRRGLFDESFEENFEAVLKIHNTGYTTLFFGTVPLAAENVPARNVEDMMALKRHLPEIMDTVNDGKGVIIFCELQPLSLLSTNFPLLEINSAILNQSEDIELKYEDLRIANMEYDEWSRDILDDLSDNDYFKVSKFEEELRSATAAMHSAISNMDITSSSMEQFEDALSKYGDRSSTRRYRRLLKNLRRKVQL